MRLPAPTWGLPAGHPQRHGARGEMMVLVGDELRRAFGEGSREIRENANPVHDDGGHKGSESSAAHHPPYRARYSRRRPDA